MELGWRGWGQVPTDFLARNCMECEDLDRETMFLILTLLGSQVEAEDLIDKKKKMCC